jgi:hypothetical protein
MMATKSLLTAVAAIALCKSGERIDTLVGALSRVDPCRRRSGRVHL